MIFWKKTLPIIKIMAILKVSHIAHDGGIHCLHTNLPLYRNVLTPIDILVQSLRVLCIYEPMFSDLLNILCKYYGNIQAIGVVARFQSDWHTTIWKWKLPLNCNFLGLSLRNNILTWENMVKIRFNLLISRNVIFYLMRMDFKIHILWFGHFDIRLQAHITHNIGSLYRFLFWKRLLLRTMYYICNFRVLFMTIILSCTLQAVS